MRMPSQTSSLQGPAQGRDIQRAPGTTYHFPCKPLVPEGGTFFQAEKSTPNWGSEGSCNPCSCSSRYKVPFIPEEEKNTSLAAESCECAYRLYIIRNSPHLSIYPGDTWVAAGRSTGHGEQHHLISKLLQHRALFLEHQYRAKHRGATWLMSTQGNIPHHGAPASPGRIPEREGQVFIHISYLPSLEPILVLEGA